MTKFVQEKMTEARLPLDRVTHKLEDRLKKLQASSLKGQDYENVKEQLRDKLSTFEVVLDADTPVSAVYEKTKSQKDEADRVLGMYIE